VTTRPPRIAAWLMKRFSGSSRNIEALLGDVQEKYQQDLSSVWYWRQTVAVILVEMCSRICATRRAAMKYAVWAVTGLTVFLIGFAVGRISSRPVPEARQSVGAGCPGYLPFISPIRS